MVRSIDLMTRRAVAVFAQGMAMNRLKTTVAPIILLRCSLIAIILLVPLNSLSADPETEKTLQQAAEKVVEEAAEMAVKKVVEEATDKTATEIVQQAAERVIEKAAMEAAEKEEMKTKRPADRWGATKVYFTVFLLDVDAIDDANQSFMPNVYLKLRWQDPRLANPGGPPRQMQLKDIWNPQVILANRQGLVSRSLPEVVQVNPDGTVIYRQRYSGTLSQPLQLSNFPIDRHTFNVQFISVAYSAKELEFVPDTSSFNSSIVGGSMAEVLSVADWEVVGFEALSSPYQPIPEINAAGFVFRFDAKRLFGYYLWQVILPLTVVVIMSWASFWIERGQPGVRIGVATSSILTLIAHRFVLASLLPRLPYMTRLDYFTVGCTLLVFLALIGVVTTSCLAVSKSEISAKRIDVCARVAFPFFFLSLLSWFLIH